MARQGNDTLPPANGRQCAGESCLVSGESCLVSGESCLVSGESCLVSGESCRVFITPIRGSFVRPDDVPPDQRHSAPGQWPAVRW